MRAGSLFSGHGQLDFGLCLAGIEHAWFCEADPWRRGILELRWPGVPVFDDVRAVDGAAPRVDLLVGGFPCKGASTAGGREGMDHPETALWREMARIAGELRPRYCLLENVANLLAVRGGDAWGEVVGDLASLGYVCSWDCLPAAAFGAPHLRDRVFAIAALTDADQEGRIESGDGAREGFGPAGRPAVVGAGPPTDAPSSGGQGAHGGREALGRAEGIGRTATDPGRPRRQERDRPEPSEPKHAAADPRAVAHASEGGRGEGERDLRTGQSDAGRVVAPNADRHPLREQPEPERGGEGAAEPGIAGEGVAPCGCLWEWIDHGGFCACCHAHLDDPRGLYAEQGDGSHRFADCPSADPSRLREGGAETQARPERERAGGSGAQGHDWGQYAGAIQRWEEVAGPAPEPLLRGVDARPARRVVRSRLSAVGDGVQVQAGEFLGRGLMRLERERLERCELERKAAA